MRSLPRYSYSTHFFNIGKIDLKPKKTSFEKSSFYHFFHILNQLNFILDGCFDIPNWYFNSPKKLIFEDFFRFFIKIDINIINRYYRCQIRKIQEKWCILTVLIIEYHGSKYVLCPKYFFITKSGRYPTSSSSILDWTGGRKRAPRPTSRNSNIEK